MTGRDPRGRLVPLRLTGTLVLSLGLAVLLGTLLFTDQRHQARLAADSAVRASVASAVASVGADLTDEVARSTAPATADSTAVTPATAVSTLVVPIAAQARDSGVPLLADVADPPAIVVPVYAGGTVPQTTDQRRAELAGYRLVPLSVGHVLANLAPEPGGLALRGPSRAVATTSPEPASAVTFAADLQLSAGPGWTVTAWVPQPGTPVGTWAWLLGLFAVFAGLGSFGVTVQRRRLAAAERRSRYDRRQALVSGLAPVVQASLDLGEVAPAVCSHLVRSLSLSGVSLSIPSETGERPLFSWGIPPDTAVRVHREAPERLERGGTFAVALTRGGRIFGVLRVVAGEPLVRADLDALATATELLGSTLAHAETFARQRQLVERLRAVDELKTVFLATASHELRTPVTAIAGFSALLLEGWDDLHTVQGRMLLERVVANSQELQSLIEQLLDFARLERGVRPTDDELLDLGPTVAGILGTRSDLVSTHVLNSELAAGCLMRGSAPAIERIVTNLVGNAGKYSPPGTRILVTVRQDDGRIALIVDDEGPGVAPEDREHVFSRFYRGHGSGVTSTRGAGVGLAIVAEYAACMGGTATVADAPSGGARFVVSFPAAESAEAVTSPAPRTEPSRNGARRVPIS